MSGTWVDGLLDGEIIHMPKGGGMWKGKFKEGKKHGMGMRLWKDGSMEEAMWERGKEAKLIRVTTVDGKYGFYDTETQNMTMWCGYVTNRF